MNKSRDTQVDRYGGEEGYRAEMARRRSMVKNIYHHYTDPTNAKAAANKRWAKTKSGKNKDAGKAL